MSKPDRAIVAHEDWISARKALLEKEKAFSRQRDELTRLRQQMPWEPVEKDYQFDSELGTLSLRDLFFGCTQLVIYHFMFEQDWQEGCKSCSFITDHLDPSLMHLAARDVSLVLVSAAPIDTLLAFRKRMLWRTPWVSSGNSEFNRDYQVQFTPEEIANNRVYYNYREGTTFPSTEGPGISTFALDEEENIYHTYSAYQRGLENFIGAYTVLDIVPNGRNEENLTYGMEWLRLKDRYDELDYVDPYAEKLRAKR